jgi:hypothetical protein
MRRARGAPRTAAHTSATSLPERIATLHRLHVDGELTDGEFTLAKRLLLEDMAVEQSRTDVTTPVTALAGERDLAGRRWLILVVAGVAVLLVACLSAWALRFAGDNGDRVNSSDRAQDAETSSSANLSPSVTVNPAPTPTRAPTPTSRPRQTPTRLSSPTDFTSPSGTTPTDAACKAILDDLTFEQGLPTAQAYPRTREAGCGDWLDRQLAAAGNG